MRNLVALDLEVYPNYVLFAFRNIDTNKVLTLEIVGADNCLSDEDHAKLISIMTNRKTFGFNSRNYDMPIILYALKKQTASKICQLSNFIIDNNSPGWKTLRHFSLAERRAFFHFDIQEPAPGVRVGLKLYGARMHSKKLRDLPITPNTVLTSSEMTAIKTYCLNDLQLTIDLYERVKDRINLRLEMSEEYGRQILSKSDAQISEMVIRKRCQILPGHGGRESHMPAGMALGYTCPDYIKFQTREMKEFLDMVKNSPFILSEKGAVTPPDNIKKAKIKIGHSTYQFGIGGIHSCEKSQSVYADSDNFLIDKDVTSYYPNIISTLGLYPNKIGYNFITVYRKIIAERLKAKSQGDKTRSDTLKIIINGSFGKFASRYSILHSPFTLINVTVTGQLAMAMLIESLELNGIPVMSANTDGFVSLVPKNLYDLYQRLCFDWELNTGFDLEETHYKSLHSRDVNNYLAITTNNQCKGKGIFHGNDLTKNPQAEICVESVRKYLIDEIPIEDTIKNCRDIRQFLHVRSVTGGAVFRDQYLGRVVRWIYATDGTLIHYKKNGNKVPKSDGSYPVMEIGEFPSNIDYARYIDEAKSILKNIGG